MYAATPHAAARYSGAPIGPAVGTHESIAPITGKLLQRYEPLSAAQLEKALATAEAAFQKWKHTRHAERAGVIAKAATADAFPSPAERHPGHGQA